MASTTPPMRFRTLHCLSADFTANGGTAARAPRLNLLLTTGGWREDPWTVAVPRILEPLGVRIIRAASGVEATNVIRTCPVHIAIVDLALPMDATTLGTEPAGTRVIQLLRRLDAPPPTVVVRPPQPVRRESARSLSDALQDGIFSVVDRPCNPETMLRIMQRIIERHYRADQLGGASFPST